LFVKIPRFPAARRRSKKNPPRTHPADRFHPVIRPQPALPSRPSRLVPELAWRRVRLAWSEGHNTYLGRLRGYRRPDRGRLDGGFTALGQEHEPRAGGIGIASWLGRKIRFFFWFLA